MKEIYAERIIKDNGLFRSLFEMPETFHPDYIEMKKAMERLINPKTEDPLEFLRHIIQLENFDSNNINNCKNVINNSPNAILIVNGDDTGLSKQEEELIDLYRNFSLEQQVKLLTYAFKLRE